MFVAQTGESHGTVGDDGSIGDMAVPMSGLFLSLWKVLKGDGLCQGCSLGSFVFVLRHSLM